MQVDEALRLLKNKGYKYTGKREKMIRIFDREGRYLSAKEMLEFMQQEYPDLSFDTIYRNMTLFEELDIVECTDLGGERKYRIRCGVDDHHHHLICLACGKTKHIPSCPMEKMMHAQVSEDFHIVGHKFEIYGYCLDCQENASLAKL